MQPELTENTYTHKTYGWTLLCCLHFKWALPDITHAWGFCKQPTSSERGRAKIGTGNFCFILRACACLWVCFLQAQAPGCFACRGCGGCFPSHGPWASDPAAAWPHAHYTLDTATSAWRSRSPRCFVEKPSRSFLNFFILCSFFEFSHFLLKAPKYAGRRTDF